MKACVFENWFMSSRWFTLRTSSGRAWVPSLSPDLQETRSFSIMDWHLDTRDKPYGKSFAGISSNAGNACWYLSTVGRIFSAIWTAEYTMAWNLASVIPSSRKTDMLIYQKNGNVPSFRKVLKCSFNSGHLGLWQRVQDCASACLFFILIKA